MRGVTVVMMPRAARMAKIMMTGMESELPKIKAMETRAVVAMREMSVRR